VAGSRAVTDSKGAGSSAQDAAFYLRFVTYEAIR